MTSQAAGSNGTIPHSVRLRSVLASICMKALSAPSRLSPSTCLLSLLLQHSLPSVTRLQLAAASVGTLSMSLVFWLRFLFI